MVGGLITAYRVNRLATSASLELTIGVVVATALSAASLAFFGYVLNLLVDLRDAAYVDISDDEDMDDEPIELASQQDKRRELSAP